MNFPLYHYDYNLKHSYSIFKKSKLVVFDEIILEQSLDVLGIKIIPDAIGLVGNKRVLIEFAKTHFVDQNKKLKIKDTDLACVEIDLSEQLLDETHLELFLLSDSNFKYWIANPRYDNEYKLHREKQSERQKVEKNYVQLENIKKFDLYKKNKSYTLIPINNGYLEYCPKKTKAINNLKYKPYYEIDIIKKIIDRPKWDGKISGNSKVGKWITFEGKSVKVFPKRHELKNSSDSIKEHYTLLYEGIRVISSIINNEYIADCRTCFSAVDRIFYYQVCKFQY